MGETKGGDMMTRRFDDILFVTYSENEMPQRGRPCYIAGGIGKWDGKTWISEEDYRPISWTVGWWAYVEYNPEKPNVGVPISVESQQ